MEIKTEKEFREYQRGCEELISRGAALGGMDYLSDEEKREYIRLSDAVIPMRLLIIPCLAAHRPCPCLHPGVGAM